MPSKVTEVQAYLDIREINGYSIQYTDFHPADPDLSSINCLVYIGLPNNPQFQGPQDPDALAVHIWQSKGPSGENKEYLFMLEQALDAQGPESEDAHVKDLAQRVRQLEASDQMFLVSVNSARSTEASDKAVGRGINRVNSGVLGDQHEEVEKL